MDPLSVVGQTIAGCQIQRCLGAGAMGAVYLADDPRLGTQVAIKLMRLRDTGLDEARVEMLSRRMTREAESLARVNHPGVARVYRAGRDGDWQFVTMRFVEGPDLATVVGGDVLGWRRALEITRDVADAMAAAHAVGVLHRDLKPENIVIDTGSPEGRPVVVDFGLARVEPAGGSGAPGPALTMQGQVLGTPQFMAPEQARGEPVSELADVYSLGATLYYLLAGRPSHAGTGYQVLARKRRGEGPQKLRDVCPDVPQPVARLVRRLMAQQPDGRIPSMARVRDIAAAALAADDVLGELAKQLTRSDSTFAPEVVSAISADEVSLPLDLADLADLENEAPPPTLASSRRNRPARDRPLPVTPLGDRTHRRSGDTFVDAEESRRVGRFFIHETLGVGGMGEVLLAHDPDLDREVAIKMLLDRGGDGATLAERFLLEARTTGQLEHPNIVPVHETGVTSDGQLWFAMKRIRGIALFDMLAGMVMKNRPHDLRELLGIFLKVCDAVAFAHSRGVIHRDLKPENIMIGEFGEVQVMDWGVVRLLHAEQERAEKAGSERTAPPKPAKREGSGSSSQRGVSSVRNAHANPLLTFDGEVIGTPAYMPPEQAAGELDRIDTRSDIYSLGAILFQMITLRPPFDVQQDPMVVLEAVINQGPPSIREADRDVPPELAAIVDRAMSQFRGGRYQSVAELQADIAAWLAGRPVSVVRYSTIGRTVRWMRRNWTVTAGVSVIVLLLVGLAISLALGQSRALELGRTASQEAARARSAEVAAQQQAEAATVARAEADTQRREAEAALATALAFRASSELETADAGRAIALLAGVEGRRADAIHMITPAPWFLYDGTCSQHDDELTDVAVDASGRLVASLSDNGTIRLFDRDSGEHQAVTVDSNVHGHTIAMTRTGNRIAVGLGITVLMIEGGIHQPMRQFRLGHQVLALDFSPDGTRLAAGLGDNGIAIVDVASNQTLQRLDGHTRHITSVAYSPDGRQLASGSRDASARVWDLATGTTRLTLTDHSRDVNSVAWSPDGSRLATASDDGTCGVWSSSDGRLLAGLKGEYSRQMSVDFHPDGHLVAGAYDGTVRMWSSRGELMERLTAHPQPVRRARFSGRDLLVTASVDRTVRLWEAANRSAVGSPITGGVSAIAVSPDARWVAVVGSGRDVLLYNSADHATEIHRFPTHMREINDVAFSPDGRFVAAGGSDGCVVVREIASRREVFRRTGKANNTTDRIAFSPDSSRIAIADQNDVALLDTETFEEVGRLAGHSEDVNAVAFSPDGRFIATGSEDQRVGLWDAATLARLCWIEDADDDVQFLDFSPDSRWLAVGSDDRYVRRYVLRPPDGGGSPEPDEVARMTGDPLPHSGYVAWIDFSADSRLLIVTTSDGWVVIRDAATGEQLALTTTGGPAVAVGDCRRMIRLAPDGALTATGGVAVPDHHAAARLTGMTLDGFDLRHERLDATVRTTARELPPGWNQTDLGAVGYWRAITAVELAERSRAGGTLHREHPAVIALREWVVAHADHRLHDQAVARLNAFSR